MLQAAKQHTHRILRGFSRSYMNSTAHEALFAHRPSKPGTKVSPQGYGRLVESGPGRAAGSLMTQDLSMTMFNHKWFPQSLHLSSGAGPAAILAAQDLGNTKPRLYQYQRRGHSFGCETVTDGLVVFKWLMLQSLLL